MFNASAAFACLLTLIICAFEATTNNVSTDDVTPKLASLPFSSQVTKADTELLLEGNSNPVTNPCHSDADCYHEGKCSRTRSGKFCKCKYGTSGDFCEIVDACVKKPKKCGTFGDVQCIYSLEEEKAVCRCNHTSKSFDSFMNQCRVPCSTDTDCTNATECFKDDHIDLKFCACEGGKGGDTCAENIDECQAAGIDCGNDSDVSCETDAKGEPFCYCTSWSVGFHHESKSCQICACGGNNTGCKFDPEDRKICYCDRQYYDNHGKCEDCNCGKESYGCKLVNDIKVCDCWEAYSDKGGVCKACYCGKESKGCAFKNGEKICTCEPAYIQAPDGICRKRCQADVPCKHGGKCIDDLCQCVPGTSGDLCEDIEGCGKESEETNTCGKWYNVACDFNETSGKPYCRCTNAKYFYDPYDKSCKDCDCGLNGNCSFAQGKKTCECEDGYMVPRGWNSDNRCVECNCGPHGRCSFEEWLKRKVCDCDTGFLEKGGICVECDCGPHGRCSFDESGKKVCGCNLGFLLNDGLCDECFCGWANQRSVKCTFSNGRKQCHCPEGYEEEDSKCHDIDECLNLSTCPNTTTCRNTIGSYECHCKLGYRPYNQNETKKYGCEDINECEEGYRTCPHVDTTECINTPGSYKCVCKSGYEPRSKSSNSQELDGCSNGVSPWGIVLISLATICGICIVGLIIVIYFKRRRRS